MSSMLGQMQKRAGLGYARGSAVESATGLVDKRGSPLPPSTNYLQTQAEAMRHSKLDSAWRHYIGDQHGAMRHEPGQPDPNVITNRASTIVDTGVDFLYGKTVTFEATLNGKPQPDACAALDGCWGKAAKRMTLLSKLAQNGAIFGHVFAKIVPPNKPNRPYCRVVPLDPAQVTVITHPDDCDTVLAYRIEWQQPDVRFKELSTSRVRIFRRVSSNAPDNDAEDSDDNDGDSGGAGDQDYYGDDPDATWQIEEWLRASSGDYTLLSSETWEHSWAPIVDWQGLPLANMHWGQQDIPPNIQHLNGVLNLTLTDINAIAKFHSFPWLYATGVAPEAQLEVGPNKLLKFPSNDSNIKAIQAYGDIAGLLSYADNLRADMDEQTRVPSVATGRLRDVPRVTSGVAFQMMYGPLLGKNTHKQRLYETGHEEISLRMLSLCGYGDGTGCDGWEVKTKWPSPLPNDDAATAQLVLAAKQAGMSEHFICQVLNVDYEQELQYRQDEQKEAMRAAMQGQAMMPAPPMGMKPAGTPVGPNYAGQQDGSPPSPSGQQPPTNHPAAVAARAKVQAAFAGGTK